MSEVFTIRRQVEFNHCDPAGIVFYPRYFEMISATIERFFSDGIGFSWKDMGLTEGYGTPMGNIEVRFHNPSYLEDWLDFDLTVKRIGRSSATLQIKCSSEGEPRFTCEATLVYANIQQGGAQSWPEEPRTRMSRFLISHDSKRKTHA